MNLNISQHSSKGSKSNQGKNACVKRLVATRYKIKPLVLFSTGNTKDDRQKQYKKAVFVNFCHLMR